MASNRFKKSIESIVFNNEVNVDDSISNNVSINETCDILSNASINTLNNAFDNECDIVLNCVTDNTQHNTSDITCNSVLSNILFNIQKDEQRGKNITFYLSAEVEAAVSQIAKQNNISKSKLVDNILKQVLLDGK